MLFCEEIFNPVVIRTVRRAATERVVVEDPVDLVVLGDKQGERDKFFRKRIKRKAARADFWTRIKVSVSLKINNRRSGGPFGTVCSVRSFVTI